MAEAPPVQRRLIYIGFLAACVATRLATTIYYVEDTDSLRFALSVYDGFDVAALQPHFPGYPVFWAAAKAFYVLGGSFAVAFSLVGGLATFAVIYFCLRLAGRDPLSIEGMAIAFILFFNPMIWLLGNRYMPDLMGLAVALAALSTLTVAAASPKASDVRTSASGFLTGTSGLLTGTSGFLTGLLGGTRLSYGPLVLPAYLLQLRVGPLRLAAWTLAGAGIWIIPMLMDTGWSALVASALQQTEGHFTEFGGTVETNPDLSVRTVRFVESVWADGFGAWWPARHWITGIVSAGLTISAAAALWSYRVDRTTRHDRTNRPGRTTRAGRTTSSPSAPRFRLLVVSALTYAVWIFLFQNVIYKSRHVLPLVAFAAIPIGIGLAALVRRPRLESRVAAAVFALAYVTATFVVVAQHREPTAIAQTKEYVQEAAPAYIASIPLVNFYLSAHGVEATYLSVQDESDRERMGGVKGKMIVIGHYPEIMNLDPVSADTFYHNPYVNRMWAEVRAFEYDK